jgi:acyl-CoA synthetase (AMP-forming)/AMP-acid ligase II
VVPRGELAVPALRAFLMERLAGHELPTQVLLRDTLPRNAAGEVLKRELRSLFTDAEALS